MTITRASARIAARLGYLTPLAATALLAIAPAGAQAQPAAGNADQPAAVAPAASIHPPAGHQFYGDYSTTAGAFIRYGCNTSGEWEFRTSHANLLARAVSGALQAEQVDGTTFRSADGAVVEVEEITTSPGWEATDLPWQLLKATAHSGTGRFTEVTYIVREGTVGGQPPAGSCKAGETVDVTYLADYYVYRAVPTSAAAVD